MAINGYAEPEKGTLNVLFHGTFVFLDDTRTKIHALIPRIDHHVYRAGTWLGETDLEEGTYQLQGTNPGKGQFDDSQNLVLSNCKKGSGAYATLILDRPDKISSLRLAKVPLASFENRDGLVSKVEDGRIAIATLQVFTYWAVDPDKLFLAGEARSGRDGIAGHYWEPVFCRDFINLHIFSAEDHFDGPSHAAEDFKICMDLIGSNLKLLRPHFAGCIREDETLPAGVIPEETEDLEPRTRRMVRFGRLVRENGDPSRAWYKDDALDGTDIPPCGGECCRHPALNL